MAATAEVEVPGLGKFIGVRYGNCGTFNNGLSMYIGHIDLERMRAGGLGMAKFADGNTSSGRWADGKRHGHWLSRWARGTMVYAEYSMGNWLHSAVEDTHGNLTFDGQPCDATDALFLELKRGALDAAVCPTFDRAHRRLTPARGLRFAPQAQVTEAVRKIEARPSRKKSMHARTPRARTIRARCGGRAVHCFLALLFLFIPHALTCHSTNSIVFAAQELPVRARVRGQRT
jgi:hypothetical protein